MYAGDIRTMADLSQAATLQCTVPAGRPPVTAARASRCSARREILAIDSAAVVFTMSGADEDYQEVARMVGAKRGFRKPMVVIAVLALARR